MRKATLFVRLAIAVATLVALAVFGLRRVRQGAEAKSGDAWPSNGQWHVAPQAEDEQARLLALGYVEGSVDAPATTGVLRGGDGRGVNLYVSGHAAEAYLIQLDGLVLHTWSYPRDEAFPKLGTFAAKADADRFYWRSARLRSDGVLIAVYEGVGIVALDKYSKLLWAHQGFNHHDIDLDADGNVYALGRRQRSVDSIRTTPIIDDVIQVLDRNGVLKREISVLDALPPDLVARIPRQQRTLTDGSPGDDVLHTNAVRWMDGTQTDKWPEMKRGRLLISIRELDALAVVDVESGRAVWTLSGAFRKQHSPELQPNGEILLFDNQGAGGTRSRILALRPDGVTVIVFDGGQSPFYSKTCGAVQRLATGNLLITETETGRALETTPRGELVWEFLNPHRAGRDGKYIAALFQMTRVEDSVVATVR